MGFSYECAQGGQVAIAHLRRRAGVVGDAVEYALTWGGGGLLPGGFMPCLAVLLERLQAAPGVADVGFHLLTPVSRAALQEPDAALLRRLGQDGGRVVAGAAE
ncbi:hypothetical protein A9G05_04185 [Pseudomonas sp. ENNP23]|nr:hypothetical protein A9G05_04185 [Pseudomonas sp. ENNP23]